MRAITPMEPPTHYPSSIRPPCPPSYTGPSATPPEATMQQAQDDGVVSAMSQGPPTHGWPPGTGAAAAAPAPGFRAVLLFRRIRPARPGPKRWSKALAASAWSAAPAPAKSPAGLRPRLRRRRWASITGSFSIAAELIDADGALQPDRRPADGRAPGRRLPQQHRWRRSRATALP